MGIAMRMIGTACFVSALVAGAFGLSAAMAAPNPAPAAAGPSAQTSGAAPAITLAQSRSKSRAKSRTTTRSRSRARKKAAPDPNRGVSQAMRNAYAAMNPGERIGIQFDLAWTGDYNGLIDGEFSSGSIQAVRQFQQKHQGKATGILTPQERMALREEARLARARVGWRIVDDPVTGARLGVPRRLAGKTSRKPNGTLYSSVQGQIQIETFRVRNLGTTLRSVFEQQRSINKRAVGYNVLRDTFFVISGTQGLKRFYVRGDIKNDEVRGVTILYDQAMEGIMTPMVVAMSSTFTPFAEDAKTELVGPPPKRKVEYGSGVIISGRGDIITDRELTDGCSVIVVSHHGNADRIAQDAGSGLALLRLHGARKLPAVALSDAGDGGARVTLAGIADPKAQGGGDKITTPSASLGNAASGRRTLEPSPPLGFSGAAALDDKGRLAGLVTVKSPIIAASGNAIPPALATLTPAAPLRAFLAAHKIAPPTNGATDAKAAIVRVICVRK
jgi:peptidoglycan hydrolase-like protein with peptidoglycan-binding domain